MDKRLLKVELQIEMCRNASACVLIDGDNVRAAFGWRISPEELSVAVDDWAGRCSFGGRTLLTFDHGARAEVLQGGNIAVQLSGPRKYQSADDALVKAAAYFADCAIMLVSSGVNSQQPVYYQNNYMN